MSSVSSSVQSRLQESGTLFKALDALTNWRAIVLLAGTLVTAIVLATILGRIFLSGYGTAALIGMFLVPVIVGAVVLTGVSAAGITLWDETQGHPPRGFVNAILAGALAAFRLLMVGILVTICVVLYLVALTALMFVLKIPAIGPLVTPILLPIAVIVTGLVLIAVFYVLMPLAAPATWQGMGVLETIAVLITVARQRLVYVVVLQLLLGLLIAVATGMVAAVMFSGGLTVFGSVLTVVGLDGGFDFGDATSLLTGGSGMSGSTISLAIAAAIILLLTMVPPMAMLLKGIAIVFQSASQGLDASQAAGELQRGLDRTREKMAEAKRRAEEQLAETRRRAEEAAAARREAAAAVAAAAAAATPTPAVQEPSAAPVPPPTLAATVCPRCQTVAEPGAAFCDNCGARIG